jgi:uncharacterized protein
VSNISAVESPVDITAAPSRPILSRRNALRLLTGGMAGCVMNGTWFEPGSLSVTRQDVRCRNLSPGFEGLRIGLLADFHFRPDKDDELVAKVIAETRREKPDLILLAGDFVDSSPAVLAPLLWHLKQLRATHGVFAVMGNHDGWNAGHAMLRRDFEKAGISFLINRHSLLSIRGESLAVAGTDFVWRGHPDPAGTLRGIAKETPVIAMVHEPDYFDVMTTRRDILLQVSGHTHGGQCRVPVLDYAPVTVEYGRKYNYGEFSRGDSRLFVTRGVGTTGPRIRFACPPELAILTLRGADRG